MHTIRRLALVGAVALGLGLHTAAAQTPDEVRAIIREEAAPYGNAGQALAIVACETGGRYHADAIGDGGTSFGIAQLHRGGLLDSGPSSFYGRGFDDPFDVRQSAAYLAWALAHGLRAHWHC